MRRAMRILTVAAVTGGVLVGTGVVPTTSAAGGPAPAEEHCVVHVTEQDATGRLHLSRPTCRSTPGDAVRAAGRTTAADWAIGTHYDGAGLTGSSLTVFGADCTGGWLNVPAGWSNRISSTAHGCPRIRHYDGYWLVSPEETTVWPGGNLGSLNNRASSIQYLP